MAKKQTRRSISVSRAVYENSKRAAELLGVPLAQFTESALRVALGEAIIAGLERACVEELQDAIAAAGSHP
jgi:hypothetical protein